MKLKLALFSLTLFLSLQASADDCRFSIRSKATADFSQSLANSCKAFVQLCTYAKQSPYCGYGMKQNTNQQVIVVQQQLEEDFEYAMSELNENLFSTLKLYRSKLQIMDQESRSQSALRRTLISNAVYYTMIEWQARYSRDIAKFKSAKDSAGATGFVVTYFATAAAGQVAKLTAKRFGLDMNVALKNLPYMSKRLRDYMPMIAGTGAIAAFTTQQVKAAKINNLPPSPAHIVHFGDKSDLEIMSQDEEAELLNHDVKVIESTFAGSIAAVAQYKTATQQMLKRAGPLARFYVYMRSTRTASTMKNVINKGVNIGKTGFKFVRLTPVSMVLGYVVFEVGGEALSVLFGSMQAGWAEVKFFRARTTISANKALNNLYFAQMRDAADGRRTIEFYKALKNYGQLSTQGLSRAKYEITRNEMLTHFLKTNKPEESGAQVARGIVCNAAQYSSTEFWKNFEGYSALNVGAKALAEQMITKIARYKSGLEKLKASLEMLKSPISNMNLGTSIQKQVLETRIQAVNRALKEAEAIRSEVKATPTAFNKFEIKTPGFFGKPMTILSGNTDNGFNTGWWRLLGLPNHAKGEIKDYLTRIIAFEKSYKNGQYKADYGCK